MVTGDVRLDLRAEFDALKLAIERVEKDTEKLAEKMETFFRTENTGRILHAFRWCFSYVVVNADLAIYQDPNGYIVTVRRWKTYFDNAEGHWAEDCPTIHAS